MATPQELATAALAKRLGQSFEPPPTALGNDASVNAAYQRLMNYGASSDAQRGQLSRNLGTNIDMSHQNREASLHNANQSFSDRGILNSGIALSKDAKLNTQYDTTDQQMTNNFNDALGTIDRTGNDYLQQYQDAQIAASQKAIQARADAEAANQQAAQQAQAQQDQQAALLAAIQQSSYAPPTINVNTPSPTLPPGVATAAINKKVTTAVAAPKQVVHGGPQ